MLSLTPLESALTKNRGGVPSLPALSRESQVTHSFHSCLTLARAKSCICHSYENTRGYPPARISICAGSQRPQTECLCTRTALHVVGRELGEGVGGRFFKTREAAAEYEADFVGGAIALLGDLDFGLVALFGGSVELAPVRPVDEHHHVGVLFDGPRLA